MPPHLSPLRRLLAEHLGQLLTPHLAAAVEVAAATPDADSEAIDAVALGVTHWQGYTFHAEDFPDVLPELLAMHAQHFAETDRYAGKPFHPDYQAMAADWRRGAMVQFTVRDDTWAVAGNLRMYLANSRHTGERVAREDTLYLLPEHRRGALAARFLTYCEGALRQLGVQSITIDVRLPKPAADGKPERGLGRLMERRGYRRVGEVYTFDLQGAQHVR